MKINNSYILLKDICCFAYHGVAPQEIELRLSKRNPPMGADIDSAGVELHCSR